MLQYDAQAAQNTDNRCGFSYGFPLRTLNIRKYVLNKTLSVTDLSWPRRAKKYSDLSCDTGAF